MMRLSFRDGSGEEVLLKIEADQWSAPPGYEELAGTLNALFPPVKRSPAWGAPFHRQLHDAAQWLEENGAQDVNVLAPQEKPAEPGAVY